MTLNPLKGSTEITVWKCQLSRSPLLPFSSLPSAWDLSLPLPPSHFLSAERCWQPRHNNPALLWNRHSGSSAVQRFPTYGARAKQGVTSWRWHWTAPLQAQGLVTSCNRAPRWATWQLWFKLSPFPLVSSMAGAGMQRRGKPICQRAPIVWILSAQSTEEAPLWLQCYHVEHQTNVFKCTKDVNNLKTFRL